MRLRSSPTAQDKTIDPPAQRHGPDPTSFGIVGRSPRTLAALQRTAGNAAVTHLLGVQRQGNQLQPPQIGSSLRRGRRPGLLDTPLRLDLQLPRLHLTAGELLGAGLPPDTVARLTGEPAAAGAAPATGAAPAGGPGSAAGAAPTPPAPTPPAQAGTGGPEPENRELKARATGEATGANNEERTVAFSVVAENLFPGRRGSPLNFGNELSAVTGRVLPEIEAGVELGGGEGGGIQITPHVGATLYQISLQRLNTTLSHQVDVDLRERSAQTGVEVEHVFGEQGGAQFSAFANANLTVAPSAGGVDVSWSGTAGLRVSFDASLAGGH